MTCKNRTRRIRQLYLGVVITAAIFLNYLLGIAPVRWQDSSSGLRGNKTLPPSLMLVTVALGPIRGLIADALWWRVAELQEQGEFFEIIKITEWITAMQPENSYVWTFHAWNLAYNIAYEFPTAETRWEWIYNGIRMLRDEGLKVKPGDYFIKSELAWLYLDRVGGLTDSEFRFYVRSWHDIMGGALEFGDRDELETLHRHRENHPDYREMGDILSLRLTFLTDTLRLDPARMLEKDRNLGPLNWRLPHASALYWGIRDEQRSYSQGYLNYRSIIPTAMQQGFVRGALVENPATGLFVTTGDLEIAPKVVEIYEEMTSDLETAGVDIGACLDFLENAIPIAFAFQEIELAVTLFDDYRRLRKGFDADIQDFYISQITRLQTRGAPRYKQALVEASLFNAYLAVRDGREGDAGTFAASARSEWESHQGKYRGSVFEAPEFEDLKSVALCKAALHRSSTMEQRQALIEKAAAINPTTLSVKDAGTLRYNGRDLSGIADPAFAGKLQARAWK
ncbi:MAG: hypothetical protein JW808_01900 [Victivallales bacterium]|nr:hypothetical protein [Victivallales bacterium]